MDRSLRPRIEFGIAGIPGQGHNTQFGEATLRNKYRVPRIQVSPEFRKEQRIIELLGEIKAMVEEVRP